MSRFRRTRLLTLALFWCVALVGTRFYWVNRAWQLRPERRMAWSHAAEWWQGMTGLLLAQHRDGLQVAELDPASGRLLFVRDAALDVDTVAQQITDLAPGHWLIITALQLGSPDTTSGLGSLLQRAGWSGQLEAVNEGGGIVVLGRSRASGELYAVASRVVAVAPAEVTLPAGSSGEDGTTLARTLSILVKPYD